MPSLTTFNELDLTIAPLLHVLMGRVQRDSACLGSIRDGIQNRVLRKQCSQAGKQKAPRRIWICYTR